jgi:hypothetical protein
MEEAALDDIIDRLLDVRNGRPGKQVGVGTVSSARESPVLRSEPRLGALDRPSSVKQALGRVRCNT